MEVQGIIRGAFGVATRAPSRLVLRFAEFCLQECGFRCFEGSGDLVSKAFRDFSALAG